MNINTDGLSNTTNVPNAILENVTSTLAIATNITQNTTSALTNATKAQENISSIPAVKPLPTTTNATVVNATKLINSIFDSYLPHLFIIVIFLIIIIPLVLDMYLA
jgi:hypothetical protein